MTITKTVIAGFTSHEQAVGELKRGKEQEIEQARQILVVGGANETEVFTQDH